MQHAGVDGRRQQIVGCRDGMNVAGEVEIEVLHGDDLAVSAACGAAFDSEGRSQTRLAHAGEDLLAQMRSQRLAQPDGRGGLAFSQGSGSDGGYHHILAARKTLQPVENREADFGLGVSIKIQLMGENAGLVRNMTYGNGHCSLRDFEIAWNRHDLFLPGLRGHFGWRHCFRHSSHRFLRCFYLLFSVPEVHLQTQIGRTNQSRLCKRALPGPQMRGTGGTHAGGGNVFLVLLIL